MVVACGADYQPRFGGHYVAWADAVGREASDNSQVGILSSVICIQGPLRSSNPACAIGASSACLIPLCSGRRRDRLRSTNVLNVLTVTPEEERNET